MSELQYIVDSFKANFYEWQQFWDGLFLNVAIFLGLLFVTCMVGVMIYGPEADYKNMGWLERIWWAVVGRIKANVYCLFHWKARVWEQSHYNRSGEEIVNGVGCSDDEGNILKTYFGEYQ